MRSRSLLYCAIASLSGFSALTFENLWFRSSALVLGSGAWSSALVLSAFMAGLALGNWIMLRAEASVRRPLRVYAAVDLAIGLTGVAALMVLPALTGILARVFGLLEALWAINLVRLVSAALVLAAPCASMGATLPLLMKGAAGEPGLFGKWLGRIYGANTAGAVLGVLACELTLVPAVGMYGTAWIAATLNVIAGALALQLERRGIVAPSDNRKRTRPEQAGSVWTLLAGSFSCGATFLAFEAVFFRFELLFFTSLSTAFAIMLAVVLAGIAVGAAAAGRLVARSRRAEQWLPMASFAAAVVLLFCYRWFPAAIERAVRMPTVEGALVSAFALAFPVAALSGVLFTLIGHAIHAAGRSETRATAVLTIANTIGGAAGAIITGFYLIEALGLEACFRLIMLAYIATGVCLVGAVGRNARARALVAGAATFVTIVALFPAGEMRDVYQTFPIYTLTQAGERRVAIKEGQLETLQVLRADLFGHPDYYRLVVNNHSMAASEVRSRRYMRLLAYLPSFLHPAPRRAALLGLGLGVTAKGLTDDARLQFIDVVDISRDIPAMLRVIYPAAGDSPLDDARVRLHVEDGRFFLQTSTDGYDIITGEPPPPHFAGVAGLYSREFFQSVRERLNPGGIVTYWLPVHDLKAAEAQAITHAFLDVFPDASLWAGAGFDWLLMATKPPVRAATLEQMTGWWRRASSAGRLREVGVDDPGALGALFLADGDRLRGWASGARPMTDNFPRRISLDAPRDPADTAAFLGILNAPGAIANFASSLSIAALWPHELRASAGAAAFERQARFNTILSLPVLSVRDARALLGDGRPDPLLIKALFWRHGFDVDRARALIDLAPDGAGDDAAEYRAAMEMMAGRFSEAAEWLGRVSAERAPRVATIRMVCLSRGGGPS